LSYETKSKILKKFLKTGDIPPMELEDRLFLSQIYRDEAEKVSAIAGRKFIWDY
jgi:hypothetical protein